LVIQEYSKKVVKKEGTKTFLPKKLILGKIRRKKGLNPGKIPEKINLLGNKGSLIFWRGRFFKNWEDN